MPTIHTWSGGSTMHLIYWQQYVPNLVATSSSSSVFPAVSMGFTTIFFGEIIAYVTVFFNPATEVVTFHLRGGCTLGVLFVVSIHQTRTWMSGSFESMQWNTSAHRLDLDLYSHPKEFFYLGNDWIRDATSCRTVSPIHYRLSYSGPLSSDNNAYLI